MTGTRFVWRGVTNADWSLHSSLVRRYVREHGVFPTERELRNAERDVIDEAREWGLDWHAGGGRLSGLELLAALQHFGAPTRFLDFTFNPLIALWFACERDDQHSGRIFAIDVTDRVVDRSLALLAEPWWFALDVNGDWAERSWVWRPPPFEARIVRQDGCFVFGGIPGTVPARNLGIGVDAPRMLRQDEVQRCTSVPFRLIKYEQAVAAAEGRRLAGRQPGVRSYTLRITHKPELRADLERTFGYTHASIYPDFPGFAVHGRSLMADPGSVDAATLDTGLRQS